ncbi:MAG: hypothetical protein H7Y59_18505, partial [Anaerolineales bacterium]|nr:hypothetical protein [Anaerolineales bacterium]
ALTLGRALFKRRGGAGGDKLTPDVKRRRLYGLLARRGYDSDICRKVIDKLMKPGEDD